MSSTTSAPVTLVLGASDNPERYSYKAAAMLLQYGHDIRLVGLRKKEVFGHEIETTPGARTGIDTVTLYVGPANQEHWRDTILASKPRRIIFNPGTENPALQQEAEALGIETIEACTLVMLSTGQY